MPGSSTRKKQRVIGYEEPVGTKDYRSACLIYVNGKRYELGADGLIVSHTEAWSISSIDAFVSTVLPSFGAPPAPSIEAHHFVQPPPSRVAR